MPGFIEELRRRRVFRVAAGYVAAVFVVLQGADLVIEPLDLPSWTMRLLLVLAGLGFLVAVTLAWAFDLTERGVERDGGRAVVLGRVATRRMIAIGVVTMALGAGAWATSRARMLPDLDPAVVAVLPFHVAGDASMEGLGEGMVDLFAMKLQGEVRPHAVDPRVAVAAWRKAGGESGELSTEQLVAIGERLGSARILTGQIVITGRQATINASLIPVAGGRQVNVPMEGSVDSVTVLVERLARALLSLEAGEREDRLALLTTTSLPALVDYLRGNAQYRRGDYGPAMDSYLAALTKDSTFGLAGIGAHLAAGWGLDFAVVQRGIASRAMWNGRERMNPVDREIVHALIGTRYPEPLTDGASCRAFDRALSLAPARTDLLYAVGDCLYHNVTLTGDPDARDDSRTLFEASLAGDSSFVPTIEHLIGLAAQRQDTLQLRALDGLLPRGDSVLYLKQIVRWNLALARNDQAELEQLMRDPLMLGEMVISFMEDRRDPALTMRMAEAYMGEEYVEPIWKFGQVWMIQGRHAEAMALYGTNPDMQTRQPQRRVLLAAMYGELAPEHGARAASLLRADLPQALPPNPAEHGNWYIDQCMLAQWQLLHEDVRNAAPVINALESAHDSLGDAPVLIANARICAAMVRGIQSLVNRPPAPQLRAQAVQLDSMVAEGVRYFPFIGYVRHIAARLFEAAGDPASALAAVNRHFYELDSEPHREMRWRESGRLAELTGDRERAIREYRTYLAYRTREDEEGRRASEPVRQALARLTGER